MKHAFLISGSFLGKNTVGLTRKAVQYLIQLDKLVEKKNVKILVPDNLKQYIPVLQNIEPIISGSFFSGWNTKVAMREAHRNKLTYVNFTSPFSIMRDSIVCIDDVRYMEKNQGEYYDGAFFRMKMFIKAFMGALFARKIITDSEFSKQRIMHFFKVSPKKITVIPCGWEHISTVVEDNQILYKHNLTEKDYYFTLGSLAKHKNHGLICRLAKNNPNLIFVIGGGVDPEIWYSGYEMEKLDNLIFTGILTDEEIKSLMTHCRAFIFPSFYEGFGIPPLEALACGTNVIVSDIAVHREIFGESVHYISTMADNVDLEWILQEKITDSNIVLNKYSWDNAGKMLRKVLDDYE